MMTRAVAAGADPTIGKWFGLRSITLLALIALGIAPLRAAEAASVRAVMDRDAFLSAVAEVETGGNARAVGRRGERGQYQFTRATWQRHTSRPFTDAHNPSVAHDVAVRHFNWLQDGMVAAGREPTPYRMAVAWNAGLNRALSGAAPRSTREYARRVSNLAGMLRPVGPQLVADPVRQVAAKASAPVAPSTAPISFSTEPAAPEVVPVSFMLSRSESSAPDATSDSDEPAAPVQEISFTLDRPANTKAPAPRRIIFATIGE